MDTTHDSLGYGDSSGTGHGSGNCSGYGSGHGEGDGYGDGDGNGEGYGDGYVSLSWGGTWKFKDRPHIELPSRVRGGNAAR